MFQFHFQGFMKRGRQGVPCTPPPSMNSDEMDRGAPRNIINKSTYLVRQARAKGGRIKFGPGPLMNQLLPKPLFFTIISKTKNDRSVS